MASRYRWHRAADYVTTGALLLYDHGRVIPHEVGHVVYGPSPDGRWFWAWLGVVGTTCQAHEYQSQAKRWVLEQVDRQVESLLEEVES